MPATLDRTATKTSTPTARAVLRTGPIKVTRREGLYLSEPTYVFNDGRGGSPCTSGIEAILDRAPADAFKVRVEGVIGGPKPEGSGWRKVKIMIDEGRDYYGSWKEYTITRLSRPPRTVYLPEEIQRSFALWKLKNKDIVWVRWTTETRVRGKRS